MSDRDDFLSRSRVVVFRVIGLRVQADIHGLLRKWVTSWVSGEAPMVPGSHIDPAV